MTIKNVTLVGANGKLGPSILDALISAQVFDVSVLQRQSSKSQYPASVKPVRVGDDLPHDDLVKALDKQDALVIAFSGSQTKESIKLIDAALEAGVQRIIPADFGSCDSNDPRSLDLLPLFKEKKMVRGHLIHLASQPDSKLSWTSIVNGHFFDWGLQCTFLGVDVPKRKFRVFDDGEVKWSASTLATIALATVRILQHEAETKNKLLYIQSVRLTQNELLKTLQKVTGDTKWEVEQVSADVFIEDHRPKLYKADGSLDGDIVEELVCVEGIVNGDWETRPDFANEVLKLPKEDLEDLVRQAVEA